MATSTVFSGVSAGLSARDTGAVSLRGSRAWLAVGCARKRTPLARPRRAAMPTRQGTPQRFFLLHCNANYRTHKLSYFVTPRHPSHREIVAHSGLYAHDSGRLALQSPFPPVSSHAAAIIVTVARRTARTVAGVEVDHEHGAAVSSAR